uniref:non-specific serine/threonine protein kinase n=1 Tax=Aegilops tauschii subsp. strangulata TaxID=200361 RepID=A0A453SIA1_AEGTS
GIALLRSLPRRVPCGAKCPRSRRCTDQPHGRSPHDAAQLHHQPVRRLRVRLPRPRRVQPGQVPPRHMVPLRLPLRRRRPAQQLLPAAVRGVVRQAVVHVLVSRPRHGAVRPQRHGRRPAGARGHRRRRRQPFAVEGADPQPQARVRARAPRLRQPPVPRRRRRPGERAVGELLVPDGHAAAGSVLDHGHSVRGEAHLQARGRGVRHRPVHHGRPDGRQRRALRGPAQRQQPGQRLLAGPHRQLQRQHDGGLRRPRRPQLHSLQRRRPEPDIAGGDRQVLQVRQDGPGRRRPCLCPRQERPGRRRQHVMERLGGLPQRRLQQEDVRAAGRVRPGVVLHGAEGPAPLRVPSRVHVRRRAAHGQRLHAGVLAAELRRGEQHQRVHARRSAQHHMGDIDLLQEVHVGDRGPVPGLLPQRLLLRRRADDWRDRLRRDGGPDKRAAGQRRHHQGTDQSTAKQSSGEGVGEDKNHTSRDSLRGRRAAGHPGRLPGKAPHLTKKKRESQGLLSVRAFSWKELHKATNGFEKLLGKGSFGEVYEGELKSPRRRLIAVKRLINSNEYSEREFTNEVQSIGQIHHRNLVCMIGYCKEGKHRMLVLEFMPGGSLRGFLFKPERPPWSWRAQAALGIARGIEYLHDGCAFPIMHCDIKPDNILLDDAYAPKITDFGISKLLGSQQVHTTVTNIRGTRGYIAPEWFRSEARIDTKVDVYSFGVVLLEMICCRKCQDPLVDQGGDETVTLFGWAIQLVTNRRTELILPHDDDAVTDLERVERFARVAFWCIEPNPSLRPTMHHVVQMLESAVATAEVLPDPPSCYMDSTPLIVSSA